MITLLVPIFLGWIPIPTASSGSPLSDIPQAVADAYDANRASFGFGSAEFEYWDGRAADRESANRGLLDNAFMADGSFAFDGNNAYYSRIFPLDALAASSTSISKHQVTSSLSSCRILTNSKKTFVENIGISPQQTELVKGYIITPGTDDFSRFAEFPLDLGRPEVSRDDLAQNIRLALHGKTGAHVESVLTDVAFEGVHTVQIKLKLANGMRTYWVDLERGAIPILTHDDVGGGSTIDRHYGQIRQVEGRGWLPFEMTTYLNSGRAKRIVLVSTAFDHAPRPDRFQLKLERSEAVADTSSGVSYTARKVYDLNNLPGPASSEALPLASSTLTDPSLELPGERRPRPPYFLITAAILSMLILAGILRRKFRNRQ